jgi:hypothetical protein
MKEEIKTDQAEMKVTVNVILQKMNSWREETKACPEKREAIPEEIEAVAERQKVPNEEAAVVAIGVPKDPSDDQRSAVGYRNPDQVRR